MLCMQPPASMNESITHVTHATYLRHRPASASSYNYTRQRLHRYLIGRYSEHSKRAPIDKTVQHATVLHKHTHRLGEAVMPFSSREPHTLCTKVETSATASADGSQLDMAEFEPCVSLIQRGCTVDALALLQQLIADGTFPERPVGDAILLVSICQHSLADFFAFIYCKVSSLASPATLPGRTLCMVY